MNMDRLPPFVLADKAYDITAECARRGIAKPLDLTKLEDTLMSFLDRDYIDVSVLLGPKAMGIEVTMSCVQPSQRSQALIERFGERIGSPVLTDVVTGHSFVGKWWLKGG